MKLLFSFLITVLCITSCENPSPNSETQRRKPFEDFTYYDYNRPTAWVCTNGQLYIAGLGYDETGTTRSGLLFKMTGDGSLKWKKAFGHNSEAELKSITALNPSELLCTGNSYHDSKLLFYLVDTSGKITTERSVTMPAETYENLASLAFSEHAFISAGNGTGFDKTSGKFYSKFILSVIGYEGTIKKQIILNIKPGEDDWCRIALLNDGNLLVSIVNQHKMRLLKLDRNLTRLSEKDFPYGKWCSSPLHVAKDGYLVLANQDSLVSGEPYPRFTSKIMKFREADTDQRRWFTVSSDELNVTAKATKDGNWVILSKRMGENMVWHLTKISTEGKKIWKRTLDFDLIEDAIAIEETKTGELLILGMYKNGQPYHAAIRVIRLDSNGNILR
jgi:hypothetical protein